MNIVLLFRMLIIISAISYLIYFFMPYFPFIYTGYEDEIAFGSTAMSADWEFYFFNLLFSLWVFASIGMFFFQKWGRSLFLVLTLVSFICDLIFGVSTTIPIESFLVHLIATLDGIIIAIVFLSPINAYFVSPNNADSRRNY